MMSPLPLLAKKRGLDRGDIITELNLRPINNADDFENALSTLAAGSRAVVVIVRGQDTLRSEVII